MLFCHFSFIVLWLISGPGYSLVDWLGGMNLFLLVDVICEYCQNYFGAFLKVVFSVQTTKQI